LGARRAVRGVALPPDEYVFAVIPVDDKEKLAEYRSDIDKPLD